MRFRHPFRALLAAFIAGPLGCSSEKGPTQPAAPRVAAVVVTPAADTLVALGQTRPLAAMAHDANGQAIAGTPFTWQSSAPAVASVSATGVVTAVANGSATITATTEGVSAWRRPKAA